MKYIYHKITMTTIDSSSMKIYKKSCNNYYKVVKDSIIPIKLNEFKLKNNKNQKISKRTFYGNYYYSAKLIFLQTAKILKKRYPYDIEITYKEFKERKLVFKTIPEEEYKSIYMIYVKINLKENNNYVYDTLHGIINREIDLLTLCCNSIEKLIKIINLKQNSENVEEGNTLFLVNPVFGSLLLHESIGHLSESDIYNKNYKFVKGIKIASSNVNIYDFSLLDFNHQIVPYPMKFDDEITKCRNVSIVKNGKLNQLLVDKEYSKILGIENHGNYRCWFKKKGSIRMRNIALIPTDNEFLERIKQIPQVVWIVVPGVGMCNSKGYFEVECLMAYKIQYGKIISRLNKFFINDNIKDFLCNISEIYDDFQWIGTMCEKKEDEIFVGMGTPSFLVKSNAYLKSKFKK